MNEFNSRYWDYTAVMAWVYLRDRELFSLATHAPSDTTDERELTFADGRVEKVEILVQPSKDPSLRQELCANYEASEKGTTFPSYKAAQEEVLTAWREGKIRVLALENDTGDWKEPPADQRAHLVFYHDDKGRYAAPEDRWRPGATKWYGLKFESAEILKIWPDPLAAGSEAPATQPEQANTLSRREIRKEETRNKYLEWYDLSQEIKNKEKRKKPTDIAKAVAKAAGKAAGKSVNWKTVKRRLDEHHPGWAG